MFIKTDDDLPAEKLDDELVDQLDWEENLEKQYGDADDYKIRSKVAGSSLARQKKAMEVNKYYAGKKKGGMKIIDKMKKV